VRGGLLHPALLFGEQGCYVVLDQEATFFQLFKHLVRGRLIFGFDAPDMTVDLVISSCEPPKLLIGFDELLDQAP